MTDNPYTSPKSSCDRRVDVKKRRKSKKHLFLYVAMILSPVVLGPAGTVFSMLMRFGGADVDGSPDEFLNEWTRRSVILTSWLFWIAGLGLVLLIASLFRRREKRVK